MSPDGRDHRFTLRPGAVFHDGTALDAAAVVFSFARLRDPSHPARPRVAPFAPVYADLEEVRAESPTRVLFRLRRPAPAFLQTLTLFAASIVCPKCAAAPDFATKPCGSGPYLLKHWERDARMDLAAHPRFAGPAPAIARVVVLPVRSSRTALEKLRAGEVHVVDHPSLADVAALGSSSNPRVLSCPSLNVCALGFNVRQAPYSDPRFRRAVSLALDRKALVAVAYHGLAAPAVHLVPPAAWRDLAPTPAYEHDPARAKALFEELGLKGKTVELIHVAIARPHLPEPARAAEWVQDQLRRCGLEVRLSAYDKSAYSQKTRDPAHPMFLLGWKGDYPDPDNYLHPLLHGANAGDLNGSFWQDPEFDRSVGAARHEPDASRRREHYARALARYREELPTLPLVHVPLYFIASARVDWKPHPVDLRFSSVRLR